MHKLIAILYRRNDLTHDEFAAHWKNHGTFAVKLMPRVRRYVQNHRVESLGYETQIDGIAEEWFDDLHSLQNYYNVLKSRAPAIKPLLDDNARFIDSSRMEYFLAEEHVIKSEPSKAYKLMSILYRRSDLTHEEFIKYWREKHGPFAIKLIPGARRYVQNHPVNLHGYETDIDGIAEVWFDDMEAIHNYWKWRSSDAAKPMLEDEKKFSERSRRWQLLLAKEIVIKEK